MMKNEFERYAPFIKNYIYKKRWDVLKEVQVEASKEIFDTDDHVIIASGTASGKTEAAFFPVLTILDKDPPDSIGVIYIGPLKALINDQFKRLDEVLEESEIPVWKWHGDVSQSMKEKAKKINKGILQITPESLEAMVMNHPQLVKRIFSDLRFVIIDEVHALIGQDRGLQLQCLLTRIENMTNNSPRRIGLSATLSDYESAKVYLKSGTKREVSVVGLSSKSRPLSLAVKTYILPEDEEEQNEVIQAHDNLIYNLCKDKKSLIFTNSRNKAEDIIMRMKDIAATRNDKDIFYVHHGNISAELRKDAESILREAKEPVAAAATLTLELGIDIGDLDMTIQLGSPFSCASFVQRLGRSGRRSGKSKMIFIDTVSDGEINSIETMPWNLLQTVAVIELYLEERWVEPFYQKPKPYSLLVQQTLSILMSFNNLSPKVLASKVLTLPPFKETISLEEYRSLLLHMIENEYIEKFEDGSLIISLKGEKFVNHYSFYSVFKNEKTYKVISPGGEIGTIDFAPECEQTFILGGKPWKVVAVDEKKAIVTVTMAESAQIPRWMGQKGQVHTKVVKRMKEILEEDKVYPYLDSTSMRLIEKARQVAKIGNYTNDTIIATDNNTFYICPWEGTRQTMTLGQVLLSGLKEELGIISVTIEDFYLVVKSVFDMETFKEKLAQIKEHETEELVFSSSKPIAVDKYDNIVPDVLLKQAYFKNFLDAKYLYEVVNSAKKCYNSR